MADCDSFPGPFRCLGYRQQHDYQRYIIAQFHYAASRNASPQDVEEYRSAGLARLYELRRELQSRQPWMLKPPRTTKSYVMDEQARAKRAFLTALFEILNGKKAEEPLSWLWEPPKRDGNGGWTWGADACYCVDDEPSPGIDLDDPHAGDLVNQFEAFRPAHRNEFSTSPSAADRVGVSDTDTEEHEDESVNADDQDEPEEGDDDVMIVENRRRDSHSPPLDDPQDDGGGFKHLFLEQADDERATTAEADQADQPDQAAQLEADEALARRLQDMDGGLRAGNSSEASATGREGEEPDLWIGTSAQGLQRQASEAAQRRDWVDDSEEEKVRETQDAHDKKGKKRRVEDDEIAISRRPKKLAREKTGAARPPKVRIERRQVDDGFHLAGKRLGKGKRRAPILKPVTCTRSLFKKSKVRVKPPNPFSEERLIELFPPDSTESAPRSTRRVYTLDGFYVHERARPDKLVQLHSLLNASGNALPDVVVVGFAQPYCPLVDGAPGLGEDDPPIRGETDAGEAKEVRLLAKWDLRSLAFSVDGAPRVVTKVAEYRLLWPGQAPVGKRAASPGRSRGPSLRVHRRRETISYGPYVAIFKRLLNVFALARTAAVRGSYVDPREWDLEGHPEVIEVAATIRRLIDSGDLAWQSQLDSYWCVAADELELRKGAEEVAMFAALPDIPFVPPIVYKLVALYFPPSTFRTEDRDAVERDMAHERRQTAGLLAKYRDIVEEHLRTRDEEPDALGPNVVKASPRVIRDRGFKERVHTWDSARVNGVVYKKGDVIVLPGAKYARDTAESVDGRSTMGDDDDDEEEEVPVEQEDDEANVAPVLGFDQCWFAVVEFFFWDSVDDELQVHLTWFTVARNVPSLGAYGSLRELFKLDRCQSWPAISISGCLAGDFKWLRPGDPTPSTGFYCRSTYNVEDGSIQDVAVLEPKAWLGCDKLKIVRCGSCETEVRYVDSTYEPIDGSDQRYAKAVRTTDPDVLFVLSGTSYHRHDTVYVEFRETDFVVKPQNSALLSPETAPRARVPFRLARLIDVALELGSGEPHGNEQDRTVDKVVVEWLVREQELPRQDPHAYLSSHEVLLGEETDLVAAVNLQGRFVLAHLDIDQSDIDLASRIAELEPGDDHFWTRARATSAIPGKRLVNDLGVVVGKVQREPLVKNDLRVCTLCDSVAHLQEARRAKLRQTQKLKLGKYLFASGALYSGGGLLDHGLEQGCPALRTECAVEKHAPALDCMLANAAGSIEGVRQSVSDFNERAYYSLDGGDHDSGLKPMFISGGSPCQGFSKLNRFKTLNDLRCAEPFVYLASLAIFRPLHAIYENVAAFEAHSLPLPIAGHARFSFFRLFVAVAMALGYQVRWSVNNAAGFGVPQFRFRIIVQLAASGMELPNLPPPTHAVKGARARRDHRLLDERHDGSIHSKKSEDSAEDAAPHWPVSIFEAVDDLPRFDVRECFEGSSYTPRPFGIEHSPQNRAAYGTPARTSYQQRSRSSWADGQLVTTDGVTHHVCRSLSQTVATRCIKIKVPNGNHEDLKGDPCYAEPPPNVTSKPAKLAQWWCRIQACMLLSPLRTTLNYDGSSQGERLHYNQLRPLSMRELLRVMGAPDCYELTFSSSLDDAAFDDQLRIIGNGVPVPLAAAFGRALADALDPLIEAHMDGRAGEVEGGGNIWEDEWRRIGAPALCAGARTDSREAVDAVRRKEREAARGESDDSVASSEAVAQRLGACGASSPEGEGEGRKDGRDTTERTSLESSGAGARRVKVEIELSDSDSELELADGGPQAGAQAGAKPVCEVIELDSDSDSDF